MVLKVLHLLPNPRYTDSELLMAGRSHVNTESSLQPTIICTFMFQANYRTAFTVVSCKEVI